MSHVHDIRRFFRHIFAVVCIFITFCMCGYWVIKFNHDDDHTVVEYREFYHGEDDIHPTISLCLKNPFLNEALARYGIDETSYLAFLMGEYYDEKMLEIDYNLVTIDLVNFIKGYRIYYQNETFEKHQSGLSLTKKQNLVSVSFNGIVGTERFFYKCFALQVPHRKNLLTFRILLSNDIFPNGIRPTKYGLRTYVHLPNQFLLSSYTGKWIWPHRYANESYKMRFLQYGIDIVTKRNKKDDSCYEGWTEYDEWLVDKHKNETKCNNPYQKQNNDLPLCNTQELMKQALFHKSRVERKNDEKPCKTMESVRQTFIESTVDGENGESGFKHGEFWFSIKFPQNRFKKINQIKYVCILYL